MTKYYFATPDLLLANLGEVDTERFISMIKRDTFDYTEWRRGLFKGKTIQEIYVMATEHEKKKAASQLLLK